MHRDSCVDVRRVAGIAIAVLAILGGCTPQNISWVASTSTIQPQVPMPQPPPAPHGYLSVERQNLGDFSDSDEAVLYPPMYLYDRNGTLLRELPNENDNPIALQPGDYIVIVGESGDPMGEFHQVQVRVVDGETTRVSQADIDHAPEFWALKRWASH